MGEPGRTGLACGQPETGVSLPASCLTDGIGMCDGRERDLETEGAEEDKPLSATILVSGEVTKSTTLAWFCLYVRDSGENALRGQNSPTILP